MRPYRETDWLPAGYTGSIGAGLLVTAQLPGEAETPTCKV
jgi:hypothetical protein